MEEKLVWLLTVILSYFDEYHKAGVVKLLLGELVTYCESCAMDALPICPRWGRNPHDLGRDIAIAP